MTHKHLTDYQIAEAFGDTLSLIYKEKIDELNEDLQEVSLHRAKLQIPQIPEFYRWFFEESIYDMAKEKFTALEHIQKIRSIYKKIKSGKEFLNIEKARQVPIASIYDFKFKGKNVSCPLHEDLHPSASIKFNRLICFQCGSKMDSIALMMHLNKVNFREAVEYLNKL